MVEEIQKIINQLNEKYQKNVIFRIKCAIDDATVRPFKGERIFFMDDDGLPELINNLKEMGIDIHVEHDDPQYEIISDFKEHILRIKEPRIHIIYNGEEIFNIDEVLNEF